MTDLVERQAVIDAIHLFFTEEIDKIPTKKTEDGEVYVIHKCQPLFEMNKALCKRIKDIPTTPTQSSVKNALDALDGCQCFSCKRIVTDGKIFPLKDNPKRGLCFDCY